MRVVGITNEQIANGTPRPIGWLYDISTSTWYSPRWWILNKWRRETVSEVEQAEWDGDPYILVMPFIETTFPGFNIHSLYNAMGSGYLFKARLPEILKVGRRWRAKQSEMHAWYDSVIALATEKADRKAARHASS